MQYNKNSSDLNHRPQMRKEFTKTKLLEPSNENAQCHMFLLQ